MPISKEVLPGIVERIRSGSSLGQEAKALGMSYRTTLITALREFMGREAYDAMIDAKRPRTRGGVMLGSLERPRPDDAGLLVVDSMSRTQGWSWRYVKEHEPRVVKVPITNKGKTEGYMGILDSGERILVVIDPEGVEYVAADDTEKAHLLRVNAVNPDGPRLRFVRWNESRCRERVEKAHGRGQELLERGEAALERKRAKAKATPEEVVEEQKKELVKANKKASKTTKAKKAKGKKK